MQPVKTGRRRARAPTRRCLGGRPAALGDLTLPLRTPSRVGGAPRSASPPSPGARRGPNRPRTTPLQQRRQLAGVEAHKAQNARQLPYNDAAVARAGGRHLPP